MTGRLVLRRGTVVEAGEAVAGAEQALVVEVDGAPRPALCDVSLLGAAQVGDDVVVNTQAVDLALGSGGRDVVHVNLTRGLAASGFAGAHVMKLNYTPLQHAVLPVEESAAGPAAGPAAGVSPIQRVEKLPHGREEFDPLAGEGRPVAVFGLHGQLAPLAWAFAQERAGARLGYVQTPGGALPGGHSRVVRELRARGLLAGHLTAGPCYGGADGEAITTVGAIDHGLRVLGWDAAVCGPGPGILGSGSRLGHGGMAALDTAHAALALGSRVVLCARMSSGDPRERHRGLSHHTTTVLDLLLRSVTVALPAGEDAARERVAAAGPGHDAPMHTADLDAYAATGLPARTMGRDLADDPLFFAAALAAGTELGTGL